MGEQTPTQSGKPPPSHVQCKLFAMVVLDNAPGLGAHKAFAALPPPKQKFHESIAWAMPTGDLGATGRRSTKPRLGTKLTKHLAGGWAWAWPTIARHGRRRCGAGLSWWVRGRIWVLSCCPPFASSHQVHGGSVGQPLPPPHGWWGRALGPWAAGVRGAALLEGWAKQCNGGPTLRLQTQG